MLGTKETIEARRIAEPNGSQSGPRPAEASRGNLLAMQIIGPSPKSTELETLQLGQQPPRALQVLWCALMFAVHGHTDGRPFVPNSHLCFDPRESPGHFQRQIPEPHHCAPIAQKVTTEQLRFLFYC